jgi:hypothetical protein
VGSPTRVSDVCGDGSLLQVYKCPRYFRRVFKSAHIWWGAGRGNINGSAQADFHRTVSMAPAYTNTGARAPQTTSTACTSKLYSGTGSISCTSKHTLAEGATKHSEVRRSTPSARCLRLAAAAVTPPR